MKTFKPVQPNPNNPFYLQIIKRLTLMYWASGDVKDIYDEDEFLEDFKKHFNCETQQDVADQLKYLEPLYASSDTLIVPPSVVGEFNKNNPPVLTLKYLNKPIWAINHSSELWGMLTSEYDQDQDHLETPGDLQEFKEIIEISNKNPQISNTSGIFTWEMLHHCWKLIEAMELTNHHDELDKLDGWIGRLRKEYPAIYATFKTWAWG